METQEVFSLLKLQNYQYETIEILYDKIFGYTELIRSEMEQTQEIYLFLITEKLVSTLKLHFDAQLVQRQTRKLLSSSKKLDSSINAYRQKMKNGKNLIFPLKVNLTEIYSQSELENLIQDYESLLLKIFNNFNNDKLENFKITPLLHQDTRKEIELLIKEAISLILKEDKLKQTTKDKLIYDLNRVLKNLSKSDSSNTIGKLRTTSIVLFSFSYLFNHDSILIKAQQKIQEVESIVAQSSVESIRYPDHVDSFHILPDIMKANTPIRLPFYNSSNESHSMEVLEAQVIEGDRPTPEDSIKDDRPTQEEMMEIVESLLGCAKTDKPAPTDEEVEQMLFERLQEKYK